MFEISLQTEFAAAHALRLPDGSYEPIHGHNWHVTVTVAGDTLDELETVMDFHELEKTLEATVAPWRNANLNDHQPFLNAAVNPSAERVAEHIGKQTEAALPAHVRLQSVTITEAPRCSATYRPDP